MFRIVNEAGKGVAISRNRYSQLERFDLCDGGNTLAAQPKPSRNHATDWKRVKYCLKCLGLHLP